MSLSPWDIERVTEIVARRANYDMGHDLSRDRQSVRDLLADLREAGFDLIRIATP